VAALLAFGAGTQIHYPTPLVLRLWDVVAFVRKLVVFWLGTQLRINGYEAAKWLGSGNERR
jgi:hypothetical protein